MKRLAAWLGIVAAIVVPVWAIAGGWNGAGTYTRFHNWVADKNAGINITASRIDEEDDGFAAGLNNALTRDGQNSPTANLPLGTFRHTNVGAAAARTDYARADQVQDSSLQVLGTVAGTNTITANATPAIAAYATGQKFRFPAAAANTGATTLNINSVGAKNVLKQVGSSLIALGTGDIQASQIVEVVYDGTQFQLGSLLPGVYLFGTATASSSATVDFTAIDGTCDDYEFRFNNVVPATNATQLTLRISQAAVFKSGAANYAFSRNVLSDAGTSAATGIPIGTGTAQIPMTAGTLSNVAGRGAQGIVRVSRLGVGSELKFFEWSIRHFDGTNEYLTTGSGFYGVDGTAIDGVRFLMATGNIATGNFTGYCYRKS